MFQKVLSFPKRYKKTKKRNQEIALNIAHISKQNRNIGTAKTKSYQADNNTCNFASKCLFLQNKAFNENLMFAEKKEQNPNSF